MSNDGVNTQYHADEIDVANLAQGLHEHWIQDRSSNQEELASNLCDDGLVMGESNAVHHEGKKTYCLI